MPQLTISLSDELLRTLREVASVSRQSPEDLAGHILSNWVRVQERTFRDTVEFVKQKNRELYLRLAEGPPPKDTNS